MTRDRARFRAFVAQLEVQAEGMEASACKIRMKNHTESGRG